jgi:hypothetical protein
VEVEEYMYRNPCEMKIMDIHILPSIPIVLPLASA